MYPTNLTFHHEGKEKMAARALDERFCLGIESTADDFGVGVATFRGEILANVSSGYIPEKGGIHPREAARHHAEVADCVLAEALSTAGVKPGDLSLIAFAQGPGLGPCLRTGATVARALASYLSVPLVGVNHSVAHIEIGKTQRRVLWILCRFTFQAATPWWQLMLLGATEFSAKPWT